MVWQGSAGDCRPYADQSGHIVQVPQWAVVRTSSQVGTQRGEGDLLAFLDGEPDVEYVVATRLHE